MTVRDRDRAPNVRQIAQKIADGHSWKHVEEGRFSGRKNEKYGPDLHITTRPELASRIEKTLLDKRTRVFRGIDKRTGEQSREIYYNKKTNTVVIVNRNDPDGGTCQRASLKDMPELRRLWKQDNATRNEFGLPRAELPQRGGFETLHPARETQRARHDAEAAQARTHQAERQDLDARLATAEAQLRTRHGPALNAITQRQQQRGLAGLAYRVSGQAAKDVVQATAIKAVIRNHVDREAEQREALDVRHAAERTELAQHYDGQESQQSPEILQAAHDPSMEQEDEPEPAFEQAADPADERQAEIDALRVQEEAGRDYDRDHDYSGREQGL
ncbi:MAG: hypothetical protein ABI377_07320 [Devosia sp.]